MRIGIDIMGGDHAPEAIIEGIILALQHLDRSVKLVLFGDQERAEDLLSQHDVAADRLEMVHAAQTIGMGEHPAKAFSQKTQSGIVLGFRHLAQKKIDAFGSVGNTGAMMVGGMTVVKSIPGVIRPCIATTMPRLSSKTGIILDVGLNSDSKPDVLYQYGILGAVYAEKVFDISSPRVGLLNLGSEEEKGNLLTKAAHEAMKDSSDFNFVGNIEGSDILSDEKADVVVCDGFVGNVILKEAEAFYKLIKERGINDPFFERFNPEQYGGVPILGINAPVLIGHGASNANAIKHLILQAKAVADARLPELFKAIFV